MNLKRLGGLVLGLAGIGVGSAAAAELVIYRCTDVQGRLTLRDTPCRKGEQQQARTMQRPTDPPPRVAAPAAASPAVSPAAERTRVVVVTPPRPLYECVTPDGERYTSETDAGQPRWVPLWTLGTPAWPAGTYHRPSIGVHGRINGRAGGDGRYDLRIGDGMRHRPHRPVAVAYPAGTWVRDTCHPLPPQEVCARLRDRRYELDRRYHSALQSERVRITTEQRGIDARLANDCGAN